MIIGNEILSGRTQDANLSFLGQGLNEVGVRLPINTPVASLGPGEVGYLIAGIKDVGQARVGETVTAVLMA